MPSSEMWHRVDLVRTVVSEELVASFFRVEKYESEKSVRRFLQDPHYIPEDGILLPL
jgi:hypothetical protein